MKITGRSVELSSEQMEKCKNFAQECAPTNVNRYKFRNQRNVKKIEKQIFTGKLAEVAVDTYFRFMGYEPNEPDFTIYKNKKKSWDCDLKIEGVSIHIKSQDVSSAKKYGTSWMFQFSSSRGSGEDFDEVLEDPDGIVVFCLVDGNKVSFEFIGRTSKCIPALLKEPRVHQLRNYKRVVYLEDLREKFGSKLIHLEDLNASSNN